MTVKKLLKRYIKLMNQNYETILITQVVNDLRQIQMKNDLRTAKRKGMII